ncbi:hypothetical protein RAB80_003925 [Fusarium oxysporum f. sp. vasinfectum]|nr:hypothetical protein RAB80_003925 [Fusarium oxysporum f. sp. vasinfectum]
MHRSTKLCIPYAFDSVVHIIALVVSVVVPPNKQVFSLFNPYTSKPSDACS